VSEFPSLRRAQKCFAAMNASLPPTGAPRRGQYTELKCRNIWLSPRPVGCSSGVSGASKIRSRHQHASVLTASDAERHYRIAGLVGG
jgi:hypothetical protein